MAIMELSTLRCKVRRLEVKATPEEVVRQGWIGHLIEKWGFPLNMLAVEKELCHFSLEQSSCPKRRIDLLAYAKKGNQLFPLLMVECKAAAPGQKAFTQVASYNAHVKAPFLALASPERIWLGTYDALSSQFAFQEGFLTYKELLKSVR
jgi:hypothetical protein